MFRPTRILGNIEIGFLHPEHPLPGVRRVGAYLFHAENMIGPTAVHADLDIPVVAQSPDIGHPEPDSGRTPIIGAPAALSLNLVLIRKAVLRHPAPDAVHPKIPDLFRVLEGCRPHAVCTGGPSCNPASPGKHRAFARRCGVNDPEAIFTRVPVVELHRRTHGIIAAPQKYGDVGGHFSGPLAKMIPGAGKGPPRQIRGSWIVVVAG